MRLFDCWANFSFTTNETKRDYYQKTGIIYELPHELTNELRLRTSGNSDISGISQNSIELFPSPQTHSRNENFVSTSKYLLRSKAWAFPVLCYFTWKLEFASNILWMIVLWRIQTRTTANDAKSILYTDTKFSAAYFLSQTRSFVLFFCLQENAFNSYCYHYTSKVFLRIKSSHQR